jgi:uncharacterized membrane protein YdjX (TVP38/TMEM64 family)
MKRYGGVAIFVFAFLWILPFDLIGIAAGVLKYSIERFLLFCWLGRLPRSLIECYIYCYTGTALFDFLSPYLPGI